MAKLTQSDLSTIVDAQVVEAVTNDSEYDISLETVTEMVEKIARTEVLVPNVIDHLEFMNKGQLPEGADIETVFMGMVAPEEADGTGATALAPRYPEMLKVYSKAQPNKVFPISIRKAELRKVVRPPFTGYGELVSKAVANSVAAKTLYKYNVKKAALGVLATHLATAGLKTGIEIQKTVDQIKVADLVGLKKLVTTIKKKVEQFMFASDSNTIAKNMTSSASSDIVVLVKAGILPLIETELYATLQAPQFASINVEIKPIDFDTVTALADEFTLSIIIDRNSIQLWDIDDFVERQTNGLSAHETFYNHYSCNVLVNPFVPSYVITSDSAIEV